MRFLSIDIFPLRQVNFWVESGLPGLPLLIVALRVEAEVSPSDFVDGLEDNSRSELMFNILLISVFLTPLVCFLLNLVNASHVEVEIRKEGLTCLI
jgi:hypothetical protein